MVPLDTWGGVLTKYLLPVVTELERKSNPNASGSEAYGWLPPPLTNEGEKVQTAWLHDFLLDPYPIRPATFLRMPRFNMSSSEATALANYFAAVDNAEFPYAYSSSRDRSRLGAMEAEYKGRSQGSGARSQGTAAAASSQAPAFRSASSGVFPSSGFNFASSEPMISWNCFNIASRRSWRALGFLSRSTDMKLDSSPPSA